MQPPSLNNKTKNQLRTTGFWRILAAFLCLSFLLPAAAPASSPDGPLVVGTKQAAPFAMKRADGTWEGISIDLWREIAAELDLEYEVREYELKDLLDGLHQHTIDVGVAALTITAEREKAFDFTHSFYTSGLGIAVKTGDKRGLLGLARRLVSWNFLKAISGLALLIGLTGFLLWIFERHRNREQFGGGPLQGLGAGFWWSAVTMTTVGYGDKAPKTFGGRLLAVVWMFAAVIVISGFTAAITSSLTVSRIEPKVQGPQDLRKVRVGSVEHSTSAAYLEQRRLSYLPTVSVTDGLQALARGEIDAVVYDAPMLQYLVNRHFRGEFLVLKETFNEQQYGFGLPEGSPWREPLNQILLEKQKEPWWDDLLYRYLGG